MDILNQVEIYQIPSPDIPLAQLVIFNFLAKSLILGGDKIIFENRVEFLEWKEQTFGPTQYIGQS